MNNIPHKSILGVVFVAILLFLSFKSANPIYSNFFSSVSIIFAAFTTHLFLNRNQNNSSHE